MEIIKKEQVILAKLKESGFRTLGGDREKALDYVAKQLEKVLLYDEEAIKEQIKERLRRDSSGELEALRREAQYERMASGLDALNRVCADLGLPPFASIDTGDRQAVEGFVGQARKELYERGIGKRYAAVEGQGTE